MRLFFGFPLPADLREALARWQGAAREGGLRAAWPRPEGLHLTLVFLGEVPEGFLPSVRRIGAEVAGRHGSLLLRTGGLGAFPERGAPRVLWMGLEPHPGLRALQEDLAAGLVTVGFPREDRPYNPHLTLARTKGACGDLPPAPPPVAWEARELVLFESVTAQGGHRYERQGAWPFSGPLR